MEVPLDVLLDIVARSHDAATIVRCAAASRHLRRGILGPSFRHILDLRAAAIGVPPGPVVAASYEIVDHSDSSCCDDDDDDDIIEITRRLRLDSRLLRSHSFKSARFELLVLWRCLPPQRLLLSEIDRIDLRVCNTFTGHVTSLPPSGLCIPYSYCMEPRGLYRCAFLTIDVAGGFELLVMDVELQTRTFCSEDGEWGPLRRLSSPAPHDIFTDEDTTGLTCRSHAAVIGETVHWLCIKSEIRVIAVPASRHFEFPPRRIVRENRLVILSLQPDAVDAKVIELPRALLQRTGCRTPIPTTTTTCPPDWLMLAATAAGTRLSLVGAEADVISTWTLEDDGSQWSRQVVVSKTEIKRHLRDPDADYARFHFEGYGEMSDSVLIRMVGVGLVQLNLGTKKATVLCNQPDPERVVSWACLHETDLVSVLQGMKVF